MNQSIKYIAFESGTDDYFVSRWAWLTTHRRMSGKYAMMAIDGGEARRDEDDAMR
jgi:hypothetical protein